MPKFELWILLLTQVSFACAVIPIHIESFNGYGHPQYVTNLNCSIGTIRQKMQVMNFDCTFPQEFDKLMIRFSLFKREGGRYQMFNIDSKEDLCKVLDKTERSNVVSRMMPMWKYYGHFPDLCPIKGDITVRRYPIDLAFYPSVFPSGDFKIVVQIIESKQNIGILNVTAGFISMHVGCCDNVDVNSPSIECPIEMSPTAELILLAVVPIQ
ncbi:uncharacterized protein LOC129948962 [Eupeodes corollae]|uniref:uncharacterized protein LOC129948962 n=1 Tax=Eupeodes corollae TaxID=290404 RepID=UPI002490542B|nr:uncharacterized protein LOC129948962 [Eupeodes corollae]